MDVSFPHLHINIPHMVDHLSIFGFSIHFYGVIIAIGMVLGVQVAAKLAKKSGLPEDIIYDLALWEIPLSVIGARIYYVLFSWDEYKGSFLKMINIREGGLAIYGGVITAFIVAFVFCRKKKVSFLKIADCAICGLILGQAVGRWGNFFNCECFGGFTDSLFAMRLSRSVVLESAITPELAAAMAEKLPALAEEYIQVHPTFLYESSWNLCIFAIMLLYHRHKKFDGEIVLLYLIGYGAGRAVIEGMRTDQLKLWNTDLAVSQLLSLGLLVTGIVLMIIGHFRANAVFLKEDAQKAPEKEA